MNRPEESKAVNLWGTGGMMSHLEETANAKALRWWHGLDGGRVSKLGGRRGGRAQSRLALVGLRRSCGVGSAQYGGHGGVRAEK